jgi:serine phosphatase RsbU (regulator of sigma subunit)
MFRPKQEARRDGHGGPGVRAVTSPALARLLLVEDDEADALLVRELLADSDTPFEIQWVRSLAEARAEVGGGFECVLLDLGLPDATGFDVLHAVLEWAPDSAVLVLTGLDDEQTGLEAMAAGAQDYLVKGQVDGALLGRAIRYARERKRLDLELRRLYRTELRAAENARLERGLLPQPTIADPSVGITTRYRPGRDAVLGGDFFDAIEGSDGCLYLLIGDVAGHGPDEAALGVCLRIAWRTLVLAKEDPTRLLPILQTVLVQERRSYEVFATLCMAVISPDRSALRLFLAGHPAPLLLAENGPRQLPDDLVGPALGVVPGVVWGSRPVELPVNWRLLLFTDGLVEGHDDTGGRLGVEGLIAMARDASCYGRSSELVEFLLDGARRLNGSDLPDDVAVLVMEHGTPPVSLADASG